MNHFKRAKHLLTQSIKIKTYSKTVYNIHGAYMNEVVVFKSFLVILEENRHCKYV